MRKFQDAYRDAANQLPKYHIDVETVLEEKQHTDKKGKLSSQGGCYRMLKLAAAAAVLFLLCGVGTVTAMNYQKSQIAVKGSGYSVTSFDAAVMSEEASGAEEIPGDGTSGAEARSSALAEAPDMEALGSEAGAEAYNQGDMEAYSQENMKAYGDGTAMADEEAMDSGTEDGVVIMECEEPVRYESLAAFREAEDVVVAVPDSELLGTDFDSQEVMVMDGGTRLLLFFSSEERSFALSQWDTRGVESYASSTSYMGESVNERSLMNKQGLSYVVFDTMEDGRIISTHAVISVNGRDLSMDFSGYEQETIEAILTQLDLSIYFQD